MRELKSACGTGIKVCKSRMKGCMRGVKACKQELVPACLKERWPTGKGVRKGGCKAGSKWEGKEGTRGYASKRVWRSEEEGMEATRYEV